MTGEDVVLWLFLVCVLGGLTLGAIGVGKWRRARDDRRRAAALAACLAGRGGREVRASYRRAEPYEASSVRREGTLPGPAMPLVEPLGDYVRLTLSVACPGAPVRWEHRLTPPDGDLTAVRVGTAAGYTIASVDGTAVLTTETGEAGERAARAMLAKALEPGGPVRTPHPEFDAAVRSVALDFPAADVPVEAHPHIRSLLLRNAPHESMLGRRDGWLTWSTLITSRYDALGPHESPENRGRIPVVEEESPTEPGASRGYPGSAEGSSVASRGRRGPNLIGEAVDALCALADVLDPP